MQKLRGPNWIFWEDEVLKCEESEESIFFHWWRLKNEEKHKNMTLKCEDCVLKCEDPNANFGWLDSQLSSELNPQWAMHLTKEIKLVQHVASTQSRSCLFLDYVVIWSCLLKMMLASYS